MHTATGENILSNRSYVRGNFRQFALLSTQAFIKRALDISTAATMLMVSMPLFLVIAVTIKLSSKGPIFFKQERIGYQGKKFRIWKFRTMTIDHSQEDHKEYIQYLLKEDKETTNTVELVNQYKNHVESRVTEIGRLLRSTSLDELPQLINIFLGDMSLVGPRPHPVYEVEEYKEWYRRRLSVKPGLAGWSKLNLRCTPKNYEESILYDLWYVDNWSILLDLRIVMLTIPFVLTMKDAH